MKWEESLPTSAMTKRSLPSQREEITDIHLHSFGDASGKGVAAAVYAIVFQPSKVSQGLIAAKARLAKQGLTIPRLELVSGHMTVNLISNVKTALEGFNVSQQHCWLDSSVALHWIGGNGSYKQFVSNRVSKIRQHTDVRWRYVNTEENPTDLASRGGPVDQSDLWWSGPSWLSDCEQWPPNITTSSSPESQAEEKILKEIFKFSEVRSGDLQVLMKKFQFWKVVRVCTWIARFADNARKSKKNRLLGPLTTSEIEKQVMWGVKRAQESVQCTEVFAKDRMQLNLQPNDEGVLQCRGRIQG